MSEKTNALVVMGTFNGVDIHARPEDRYVDVTEMCQAHKRKWSRYAERKASKRFRRELSTALGISDSFLVREMHVGSGQPHTFAHRRIALHCAAWISGPFEQWVYEKIETLLTTGTVSLVIGRAMQPPIRRWWSERLERAWRAHVRELGERFPTCFTVASESLGALLLSEDEAVRHCLPLKRGDRPDGSLGKCWANYYRKQGFPPVNENHKVNILVAQNSGKDGHYGAQVYDGRHVIHFRHFYHTIYLPEKLYLYLDKYSSEDGVGHLPPASCANQISQQLGAGDAVLPPKIRRQLASYGGIVIAGSQASLPLFKDLDPV
jgi:hypothetical protein